MKLFEMRQIQEAKEYAIQGSQALHLHSINSGHPLFGQYPVIAHLFDQNPERLKKTARSLGVRLIRLERAGQPGQHIDLCGRPLERARARVEKPFVATHVWHWKSRLPERKDQPCRILIYGRMNSCLVEFQDGIKVITSRWAVLGDQT